MKLKKILSGGQSGADIAGLVAAKRFGLETGGAIPKGFKTLDGPKPEYVKEYGLTEHSSPEYPPRTYQNVRDSDGTVRFAGNFKSAGELCTLKAIDQYDKPNFDVDIFDPRQVDDFIAWLSAANISILNVAGNSERTCPGTMAFTLKYLTQAFLKMGIVMKLTKEEIFGMLEMDPETVFLLTQPDHYPDIDTLYIQQRILKGAE